MKNKTFLKLLSLIFILFLIVSCTTSKKNKCDTCPKWSKVNIDNSAGIRILV